MSAPTSVHASAPAPSSAAIAVAPREAGRLLSLGMSEIYERMRNGELESYRDGRARRITMASIHAYVASRCAASADGWKQISPQPPRRHGRAAKEGTIRAST